jgi:tetratricopeptide (TPR) repeat protein
MADDSSERMVLLNRLADEFADRFRRGERPTIEEYVDRHPQLADEIRDLFPALAMMEEVKEEREAVSEPAAAGPLPALVRLGDYRIIREIGRGGMGVVYEAEQVSLGRHVALKVLPPQLLVDARTRQRFEREARAAARLHHTNIVPVFGVGEHDGLPYYVMQFIQGLGLDEVLEELKRLQASGTGSGSIARLTGGELRAARKGAAVDAAHSLITGSFAATASPAPSPGLMPADGDSGEVVAIASTPTPARRGETLTLSSSSVALPGSGSSGSSRGRAATYWHSVARIGLQVADALQHAHTQGVYHRDIKPSNLLLDTAGTIWVTDFGLAKAEDQKNLTHTGDILGTLRYMPPEAFDGKADGRGDIYSLGLTLYELLALEPVFNEQERNRLIKQVTTSEPRRLRKVNREVPRDLETIVHKAAERDAGRRYQSANELAADLQRFLDDEPIIARRQTHLERYLRWARHNPGIAVLGAALTAVLVAVTVASLAVAGRMAELARSEAQAAQDERSARTEAVGAQLREAQERAKAEAAKQAAVESKQRAEQALAKAEENYATARAAVNDYLTAVSGDEQLKAPGLQGLRMQLLQSALRFYQDFLKERGTDPALRQELAGVYAKVGRIYLELDEKAFARQAFAQAQRLYEALVADNPADRTSQHGLAMALVPQGYRSRAIAILETLVRPEDPQYQADLGYGYNDAGTIDAKDDPARSLEFLRKALDVRERLARLRPDDPDARLGLSASLNNIAIRIMAEHPQQALELLRRAVAQAEAAYRLRPAHLLTAHFLTVQLLNVADRSRQVGLLDEAAAAHRRRVEVLDRRARDNPTVTGFDTLLAQGLTQLLEVLLEAGRLDEAARAADKGRDRLAEATEETTELARQAASFHLAALLVAQMRARTIPNGAAHVESAGAAAVRALREHVLAGLRDVQWMQTAPETEPLRQRADFRALLSFMEQLQTADRMARRPVATADEKLAGRQKTLATLEAMVGAQPAGRLVRRRLAQARQDLARALLDAGRLDEARLAFAEALQVRERLVAEYPSNEQLRADLAQNQSLAGDFFAAAGKLADAARTWDQALATLEAGLKSNPNSLPFRTALTEQLVHIADQHGKVAAWDAAAQYYRRAFAIQPPADVRHWYAFANALAETGAAQDREVLMQKVIARLPTDKGVDLLHTGRILLLTPPVADVSYRRALKRAASVDQLKRDWPAWCHALGAVRMGQAAQALPWLDKVKDPLQKLPVQALALQQLGRRAEAVETLAQADRLADQRLRDALAEDHVRVPDPKWADWLTICILHRQAHEAIHGAPAPRSPYDVLLRGRMWSALGEHDKAEAEFAAAVTLRPDDIGVRLARGRIYARLARTDRMADDLARAQQLGGDDPKTWIETGRMLVERGEPKQAERAFARAGALGKGELNRFLEAGWWVIGPYPADLTLICPPETNADPSQPVPNVGREGKLKWQSVPADPVKGLIKFPRGANAAAGTAYYALACVHADQARTATIRLQTGSDLRVWVNGKLVFDGFAAWGLGGANGGEVPIALRAGQNQLLIKTRSSDGTCAVRFDDTADKIDAFARLIERTPNQPRLWIDWGRYLGELGRWSEAGQAFAKAMALAPRSPQVWKERGRAYAELGKYDEAAGDFVKAIELAPAGKAGALPWFRAGHAIQAGIDDVLVQWDAVFTRVAKTRPTDALLWARRAQHFAGQGRWAETEAPLRRHLDLDPTSPYDPFMLAPLLLERGDVAGYRATAGAMIKRFGDTQSPATAEKVARVALLSADAGADVAALTKMLDNAQARPPDDAYAVPKLRLARALLAYRSGDAARAVQELTTAPALADSVGIAFGIEALALLAMARHELGQVAEARADLARAHAVVEYWMPIPPRGRPFLGLAWSQWLHTWARLREAEGRIPPDPATIAATLSPSELTARTERRTRADRLSIQAALAQIRRDIGQTGTAVAELRAVLAGRAKIAAEEPRNVDYQADVAATRLRLGTFLADNGKVDDAVQCAEEALAALAKIGTLQPNNIRLRIETAAAMQALGDVYVKAYRPPDAMRAWKKGVEQLTALLKDNASDRAVERALAVAEVNLGRHYAALTCWPESGEILARAARRPGAGVDAAAWHQGVQALFAASDRANARQLAADAFARLRYQAIDPRVNRHLTEIGALADGLAPDPEQLLRWAESAATQYPKQRWRGQLAGLCLYRAKRYDEAIRRLTVANPPDATIAASVVAMAHFRLGHAQPAQAWLQRAATANARWMQQTFADSGEPLANWTTVADRLILYREAHELITGTPLPADPLEQAYCAQQRTRFGLTAP